MRNSMLRKRVLAFPGGIVMGDFYPPPVIVRISYGRRRALVGDVYYDSGFSTRASEADVIQKTRMPSQGVGSNFLVMRTPRGALLDSK
ncbi:hypothetical protein AVEN_124712-1 [Araneus ventricosus]|uniref:Uncharacterized protein n=1 Tax=Araneus ventricosus TaxID=182803 RepID=A0A4Y2UEE5_ARAVE|nr:hypothetical protein AVEN_124712-1 [Araneus ventricosus]